MANKGRKQRRDYMRTKRAADPSYSQLSKREMRKYRRKQRAEWKAAGMCVQCGARKAKKNRVSCRKCLERNRVGMAAKRPPAASTNMEVTV